MRKVLLVLGGAVLFASAFLLPLPRPRAGPSDPDGPRAAPAGPAELGRIAGWRGLAPNARDSFRFVVLSDRTGGHVPGQWAEAIADVNRLRPDFVMSIGDFIEGSDDSAEAVEREWREVDALNQRLLAPLFYCPGNHDVGGPVGRRIYTRLHGVRGRTYYSFDCRGCHFVVIDSMLLPLRGERAEARVALTWLADDLASAGRARHVFVFSHYPLYAERSWKDLRPLLDAERTTVFCGHWHALSHTVADGVRFYVLAATAAHRPTDNAREGKFNCFAHVVVSAGQPAVSIIPVGQVKPHDLIPVDVPPSYSATRPAGAPAPAW